MYSLIGIISDLEPRLTSGFTQSDNVTIRRLYFELLNKQILNTGCRDCYRDAYIEICVFIKKRESMKKCDYVLKNGVVLRIFGNENIYTNINLTNNVAESYLRKFPDRIDFFFRFPEDWEARTAPKKLKNEHSNSKKDTK